MRLIDADALSGEVDKSKYNNPHSQGPVRMNHRNEHDHFLRMIYKASTVDAVEVVHGRWIKGENWSVTCSVCGSLAIAHDGKNYCPYCGAKMDG